MRPFFATVLALLALTGCDPGYNIRGRVREAGACGGASAEALPLASVAVEVDVACPGRPPRVLRASTSTDGTFSTGALGDLPPACTLRVRAPGHEPRTYAVQDLCASHDDRGGCWALFLDARLAPVAAAAR